MNRPYAVAALLCLLAAGVRTFDGQTEILPAASAAVSDQALLGFFHLTWYLVTVCFTVSSVALGYLSINAERIGLEVAGSMIGVLFVAWSATIALVSNAFVWHPGTVIPTVVTLVIGGLSLLGARSAAKTSAGS